MKIPPTHAHNGIRVNSNDSHIKKVKRWIECFVHELNIFEDLNDESEIWRQYAERPMVSLMATGIARNDNRNGISILQEYSVYKDHKFLGRADLFISYPKAAYLLECKYTNGKGGKRHWNREWEEDYFLKILEQGNNYLFAEKREHEYYPNLYIGCIIFQQISHTSQELFQKHIMSSKEHRPKSENSFYTFITKEPLEAKGNWYSGLEVYGVFRKIK